MESRKMVLMILFAGQQWRWKQRTGLGTECQEGEVGTETVSLKHKHQSVQPLSHVRLLATP